MKYINNKELLIELLEQYGIDYKIENNGILFDYRCCSLGYSICSNRRNVVYLKRGYIYHLSEDLFILFSNIITVEAMTDGCYDIKLTFTMD